MTESPENYSRNMKKNIVATHHATEKKPELISNKDYNEVHQVGGTTAEL